MIELFRIANREIVVTVEREGGMEGGRQGGRQRGREAEREGGKKRRDKSSNRGTRSCTL